MHASLNFATQYENAYRVHINAYIGENNIQRGVILWKLICVLGESVYKNVFIGRNSH